MDEVVEELFGRLLIGPGMFYVEVLPRKFGPGMFPDMPCVVLDRKRVLSRKVLLDDANAVDGEAGRGRRIG